MLNCSLDNSSKVNKIIHNIIVNTEANTTEINPPIDLHQGDTDTQVLFFQLRNNKKKYISIDSDYTAKIEFYNSVTKSLVSSDDVTIENRYRGQLSYVVGDTVIGQYGRYTTYLKLYRGDSEVYSISFVVVVAKNHSYSPKSNEVVMTKDFYDTLNAHMDNQEIHVGTEDRDFLDTFNDKIEDLNDLLAIGLHVDDELSTESTNPVENRVITSSLNNKESTENKVQEIDYNELDEELWKRQYPSVYATVIDKITEIDPDHITEEDLPKNVTLSGLLDFANQNNIKNPNLWELKTGCYSTTGPIKVTPADTLDSSSGNRLVLTSNVRVVDQIYCYVSIIMPVALTGLSSGIATIYCFYEKGSTDPDYFSYQTERMLTSLVTESSVTNSDNRVPLSSAVVDYVANKLSVIEVTDPNLWELSTGMYLCSGDISVTEETVVPIGDSKVYAFINRIGDVGEESNLFTLFNMPFGIMYGYSDDASHGQIHGTVDDSQISISLDSSTADNDHIPTTKAVTDYVDDRTPSTVTNPVLHTLDDGMYVVSGTIDYDGSETYSILTDSAYLMVTSATLPSYDDTKLCLLLNSAPSVVGSSDINSVLTSFLLVKSNNTWVSAKVDYLTETNLVTSLSNLSDNDHIPTAKAVVDYVDNLISAINGGSY